MKNLTAENLIDATFSSIVKFTLRMLSVFSKKKNLDTLDTLVETNLISESIEAPLEKDVHTFKTVHDILKVEKYVAPSVLKELTYYASSITVPVYKSPTIEFDAQIGTIPYGEAILMHEAEGRFFRITWRGIEGWVLREDCADRASKVYPEFRVGQEHSVDHPNTAHVRAIIGDEFGAGRSEYALQSGEYVLYILWRKGIRISWPPVRPRVPGLWHNILKGLPHVHIGVLPKTGVVMEYVQEGEIGHVAYVEAVFPDDTISISEANFPDSGIYSERTLTKEEWKKLKPVFIQCMN